MNKCGWANNNCNSITSVCNTVTSAHSSQWRYFTVASKEYYATTLQMRLNAWMDKCVAIFMEWYKVTDRCYTSQLHYTVIFAPHNFPTNSTCYTTQFAVVLHYSVLLHICTALRSMLRANFFGSKWFEY